MTFDHLTHNQRRRIVEKVDQSISTFRTQSIEDIVRWTVDAFMDVAGEDRELEAFERGVADALDGKYQAVG